MKIGEYFRADSSRKPYSWRGVCSVEINKHPLSNSFNLPSKANFIVIETFVGKPNLFLERSLPFPRSVGQVMPMQEYARILDEAEMPADRDDWVGYPPQQFMYAPTLNIAAHVEIPSESKDGPMREDQIRAVTVFQKETSPPAVPVYIGNQLADALQLRGFGPNSFPWIRRAGKREEQMGHNIVGIAGKLLNTPFPDIPEILDLEAATSWFSRGQLREVTRTPRHDPPTRS